MTFIRPEHEIIGDALLRMNHRMLLENSCWFGGGTAIVLRFGEYRRSLDIDFLCSDLDGYREIRNAIMMHGPGILFSEDVKSLRDVRADQYGIRMFLEHRRLQIKFEIVRESRIEVEGEEDPVLKVPTLLVRDMFAEKLLANADRAMDRSVSYRDAIDLGRLVEACGAIPEDALAKATEAYGDDVRRKAVWVVNRLQDREELHSAATTLQMDPEVAEKALVSLRETLRGIWPEAQIDDDPHSGR